MATKTSIEIQNTFSIYDEKGAKLPGDLVALAMADFLQDEDAPLLRAGMMTYGGIEVNNNVGGELSSNAIFSIAQGSTIVRHWPNRTKALQTTDSDLTKLTYSQPAASRETLYFDKPIIAKKFKINSFDQFLFNATGDLISKVFSQMQLDIYKGWATLFYKNVRAATETVIDTKKRTTNLTVAKIKANPNLFIEWLEEKTLLMERKLDEYTSHMPRKEIVCFAAPEIINAIAFKLGELGRTIKFLETSEKYRTFYLQGVLVVEDRLLKSDLTNEFVEGIDVDLTDLNAVVMSRRNQIFVVGKVEIKSSEDVDFKDPIRSYRSLYTYKTHSLFVDEAHALLEAEDEEAGN